MLDEAFKKQRALQVRDLADRVIDPFIKQRLLRLAERYETDSPSLPATPNNLQFVSRGGGPER